MVNIKSLKNCEILLKVRNEIKKYVKVRLLNLINDIDQVFPVVTAIK